MLLVWLISVVAGVTWSHLVTCLWKSVSCLWVTVTAPPDVSFGKPFRAFSNQRQNVWKKEKKTDSKHLSNTWWYTRPGVIVYTHRSIKHHDLPQNLGNVRQCVWWQTETTRVHQLSDELLTVLLHSLTNQLLPHLKVFLVLQRQRTDMFIMFWSETEDSLNILIFDDSHRWRLRCGSGLGQTSWRCSWRLDGPMRWQQWRTGWCEQWCCCWVKWQDSSGQTWTDMRDR